LDVLFDGWEGDGRRGRNLLLGRLRAYRAARPRDAVRSVADVIYRTLICFGEAVSDMSFVHLAVECRDVLVYEPRAGAR
jgi:hypothetical protein